MGNLQTQNEDYQDIKDVLNNYEIIQKISQPDIGELVLLKSKQNQKQYILREYTTQEEQEASLINKRFNEMVKLNHPSIVQFILNKQSQDSQLCSNFYKQYIIYEYLDKSIETEIQTRMDLKNQFSEQEILKMLQSAISGFAYFQKQKITHQNIQASQLFLTPEGTIKIYDSSLFMSANLFAQVVTSTNKELISNNIYLAPILVQAVKDQIWQPHHDLYKSDVFSLGMCFVHIASLTPCKDCYNYDQGQFFEDNLENQIQILNQTYSQELIQILKIMLLIDEQQRPDFIQLEEFIQQQQYGINNKYNQNVASSPLQQNNQEKVKRNKQNLNEEIEQQPQQEYQQDNQKQYQINDNNNEQQQEEITQNEIQNYNEYKKQQDYQNQQQQQMEQQENQFLQEQEQEQQQQNYYSKMQYQPEQKQSPTIAKNDQFQNNYYEEPQYRQQQQYSPTQQKQQDNQQNTYQQDVFFKNNLPPQQVQQSDIYQNKYYEDQNIKKYTPSPQFEEKNNYQSNFYEDQNFKQQPQAEKQQLYQPIEQNNNQFSANQYQQKYSPPPIPQYQEQSSNIYDIRLSDEVKKILQEYESKLGSFNKSNNNNIEPLKNDNSTKYEPSFQKPYSFNANQQLPDLTNKYQINNQPFQNNFQLPSQQVNSLYTSNQVDQILQESRMIQSKKQSPQTQQSINQYGNLKSSYDINNSNVGNQYIASTQPFNYQLSQYQTQQNEIVIENFENGSKYEGYKKNGVREGQGTFTYQDGGKYVGEWHLNQMHGRGVLYYSHGQPAYDGQWQNDAFNGYGLLYNDKQEQNNSAFDYQDFDQLNDRWIKYEGSFLNDNKSGQGVLYLSNGEKFEGSFLMDALDGEGKFYCKDGNIIKGIWKENKLVQQIY